MLNTRWFSTKYKAAQRRAVEIVSTSYRTYLLRSRGLTNSDKIFTATTPPERDTLFRLARLKAGGVAVEVGSAYGASSCFIAAGIGLNGGKLYCVDRWNVEYQEEEGGRVTCFFYREDGVLLTYDLDQATGKVIFTEIGRASRECPTYNRFLENTSAFRDVIVPVKKESSVAAQEFQLEIDFLFIDGWHEYNEVSKDCDIWMSRLKTQGIIVLHDCGWAEGVKQVISDRVKPATENHSCLPNMFWAVKR